MWCVKLILISCIGLVTSRPQSHQEAVEAQTEEAQPQVEIERQIIHEVIPLNNGQGPSDSNQLPEKKLDANTKEILEKIAEVNKKQGLSQKKSKPPYFHFPLSYSRSQDGLPQESDDFKFSRGPFTNPIFEYLEKGKSSNSDKVSAPSFRRPNFDSEQHPDSDGLSLTDTHSEIDPSDNIPGHYIKRKVTHYQSFVMPNPYMFNMFNMGSLPTLSSAETGTYSGANSPIPIAAVPNNYQLPNHLYGYPTYPYSGPGIPTTQKQTDGTATKPTSENETIENIKNIILGSQFQGDLVYNNDYYQRPQKNDYNQNYLKQKLPHMASQNAHNVKGNIIEAAAFPQAANRARQNWNWPGANLFPIYIRDPFLQMYYAVTNMVEYGPSAGNEGPCKLTPRPQGSRIKPNPKTSQDSGTKGQKVILEMNKREGTDDIKVIEVDGMKLDEDMSYLDVEEIDIGDDDLVKFTINLPKSIQSGGRDLKANLKSEKMGWDEYIELRNDTRLSHLASDSLDFNYKPELEAKQSPPIKNQIVHVEELEDETAEAEKAEDINVSNENSRKVFSKDNTGNGIFINKLRVRKGGVAIAGPGGIATAGSGGTAIVGPNGVAYTHPDGLAIAGSGTKVVAVDPTIDLNEVIKDSVLNGTRHVPNTRVGKVVAVGPVVYYNRG